jgi:hypothetical protein
MRLRQNTDGELASELEAIATAAAERSRAHANGDPQHVAGLQRSVGEAASRAIAAGVSLGAIADAERIGQQRAREELGREVLRAVERAAQHKHEAENGYEQAILRAARLGLAHRDVAQAAQVAHGTVRAILARTQTTLGNDAASTTSAAIIESDREQQSADSS